MRSSFPTTTALVRSLVLVGENSSGVAVVSDSNNNRFFFFAENVILPPIGIIFGGCSKPSPLAARPWGIFGVHTLLSYKNGLAPLTVFPLVALPAHIAVVAPRLITFGYHQSPSTALLMSPSRPNPSVLRSRDFSGCCVFYGSDGLSPTPLPSCRRRV